MIFEEQNEGFTSSKMTTWMIFKSENNKINLFQFKIEKLVILKNQNGGSRDV